MVNIPCKNDQIGDRISKIKAQFCNNSNRKFAELVGIDETTMSSICNGKKNPTDAIKEKIIAAVPTISRPWLYFGEGEMLISENCLLNEQNIIGNTAPVAANGSTINQSGITNKERELYESLIASLNERIQQQADYIRILSEEHRGLVHKVVDITTDTNETLKQLQTCTEGIAKQTTEIRKIGFELKLKK